MRSRYPKLYNMIERAPIEHIHIVDTYDAAKLYCTFLTIDSKSGWRLPNSSESAIMRMMMLGGVLSEFTTRNSSTHSVGVWSTDDESPLFFVKSGNKYVWPVLDVPEQTE